MARVRVTCQTCDVIEIPADVMTVVSDDLGTSLDYRCPRCGVGHLQALDARSAAALRTTDAVMAIATGSP